MIAAFATAVVMVVILVLVKSALVVKSEVKRYVTRVTVQIAGDAYGHPTHQCYIPGSNGN